MGLQLFSRTLAPLLCLTVLIGCAHHKPQKITHHRQAKKYRTPHALPNRPPSRKMPSSVASRPQADSLSSRRAGSPAARKRHVPPAVRAGAKKNTNLMVRRAIKRARKSLKVKEADIYKIRGHYLYYLHTYRGFIVFDLRRPEKPLLVSSVGVYGTPVEMFVERSRVYMLINNVLGLEKERHQYRFVRRNEAQIVSVDITQPQSPEVLHAVNIPGTIREGVARKVGHSIYVLAQQARQYRYIWKHGRRQYTYTKPFLDVMSFSVKDPRHIRPVSRLPLLPKKTNTYERRPDGSWTRRRYLNRYVISATPQFLMIAQHWYAQSGQSLGYRWKNGYRHKRYRSWGRYRYRRIPYKYKYRCVRQEYAQITHIQMVDIRNPNGYIRPYTSFDIEGTMGDQFKQTYVYDAKKKRKLYLGITLRNKRVYNPCGKSHNSLKNTVVSVDISEADNPKLLDYMDFGKPNETVRGSTFDPQRKVLFAITAIARRDPLYAISFRDPTALKVMSEIDGLSGDMNLFRFVERRKFLLAVGRDNSSSCKGFGRNNRRSRVSVSLIDVRDLRKIRLVQRKCLGNKYRVSRSQVNQNRDQAHKMVSVYQDGKVNLLSVPFYVYGVRRWRRWHRYGWRSAIGVLSWDLARYKPEVAADQQNVLREIGTFTHKQGMVKRTIISNIRTRQGRRRVALNLSSNHMSIVDLQKPSNPSVLSSVALAPKVVGVYRFGRFLVEHRQDGAGAKQTNTFVTYKLTRNHHKKYLSSRVEVGPVKHIFRVDNALLLFQNPLNERKAGNKYVLYLDQKRTHIRVLDVKAGRLRKRAVVKLPYTIYAQKSTYCGHTRTCVSNAGTTPYGMFGSSWIVRDGTLILSGTSHIYRQNRVVRSGAVLMFVTPGRRGVPKVEKKMLPYFSAMRLIPMSKSSFLLARQGNRPSGFVQRWMLSAGKWRTAPWQYLQGQWVGKHEENGKTYHLVYHYTYREFQAFEVVNGEIQLEPVTRLRVNLQYRVSTLMLRQQIYAVGTYSGMSRVYKITFKDGRFHSHYTRNLVAGNGVLRAIHKGHLLIQYVHGVMALDVRGSEPAVSKFVRLSRSPYITIDNELVGDSVYIAGGTAGLLKLSLLKQRGNAQLLLAAKTAGKHKVLVQFSR
ncbi:MAG: hypothetical protein CL920_27830 [Deltaproteobacteria bacterium]|nr:hypothetical protein [Deltaproteobacteria bacterium]